MISVSFDCETGLSFCRLKLLGMGLQKPRYQNEYQMANPCGYCTCLIMMKHVSFSPNLYITACQFYVMFLVTFKPEGHTVWTNLPTCQLVDLHAKKCNESKTPHICWLLNYLKYEWGFPRVQLLFQTDIKTLQKASVASTSANSIDHKLT